MNDKNNKSTNSISECLVQVINLTKKNVEILKALNESFYTKRNHLAVVVNDETFVIPSFISLESRIESLEQNIQNLVDAPLTGEAFTYFDGTTQRMQLSGYSTTPNHVDLFSPSDFNTERNNIFKDFMTPNPFITLDLNGNEEHPGIPNNIKHVIVRKIAIKDTSSDLVGAIQNLAESQNGTVDFADVERILYGYKVDEDYILYDNVRRLPIRKGVSQGEYDIMDIIDNYQDANFDEFYELKLDRDLVYYINNGTIQRDIKVGDTLVTWNDKVMMEVVDLNQVKRTITIKVLHGAYADLQDKTSGNASLYKLKYYKNPSDIDATKYINVPLEEDRYVMVFVSPINDTTNTQAPWGRGVFIDVDTLKIPSIVTEEYPEGMPFRVYYDQFVNNIGDALAGITAMMDDDQQVSKLTNNQFKIISSLKPEISKDLIKVTQINKHLNDTKSIKTIRNLYDQKNKYKTELDTVQRSIDQINKQLAELSFDDSTNSRTVYETQISEYNLKKSELVDSITKIMQEISLNANNSETPIENAKYHIRGFIPTNIHELYADVPDYVEVIKLDVEYRYKNKSNFTGNAETFGDNYIFSDWNKMDSIYRKKIAENNSGYYSYKWEKENSDTNNPSYDQIDIPITQGEMVDIRVRYIYNIGYPFVEVRSDWSPIYTQEFPAEYLKNVEVLDIIAENNDEIKSQHFENILKERGLLKHVEDELVDQSITYMHKAESITSGFLTEERRVIPLDIKLQDFYGDIENLKSEVFGAASTNLIVTLNDSHNATQLKPNIFNRFHTISYKNALEHGNIINFEDQNSDDKEGKYVAAISQLNITLYNAGSYDMKLYSLFPGSYETPLNPQEVCLFPVSDYATDNESVFMMLDNQIDNNLYINQTYNQFMYFRRSLNDISGSLSNIYKTGNVGDAVVTEDNLVNNVPSTKLLGNRYNIFETLDDSDLSSLRSAITNVGDNGVARFGFLYPYPGNIESLSSPSGDTFIVLSPGESITIPINFVYWFNQDSNNDAFKKSLFMRSLTVTRMLAFDIRTSLYQDPITYKFVVDASFSDTKGFTLKDGTISGVHVSDLQRLTPSTPKTVARNATELIRSSKVQSNNSSRIKKH